MSRVRRVWTVAGLLALVLVWPQVSFGITGCNNAYLIGTYNAKISSLNFMSAVTPAGAGGSTGGSTGAVLNPGGFGNNPASLSGQIMGLGRFYFDGYGNIIGQQSGTFGPLNLTVGSYSVNTDCTATLKLSTGETFDGVITSSGQQVLFVETDATGNGASGSLTRAPADCLSGNGFPESFGFSFSGTQLVQATATSTAGLRAFTAIGAISLNGDGGFTLSETMFSSAGLQRIRTAGTYTVGADCSLRLSFNAGTTTSGGTSGAFVAPAAFNALLINPSSGLIAVQPTGGTAITGDFSAQ